MTGSAKIGRALGLNYAAAKTRTARPRRILVYAALVVIMLLLFFPLFWMISTSLKTSAQAFAIPPIWIPTQPTFQNYAQLAQETFITYFVNSLIVSTLTTLICMVIASMSAYSFTRLKTRTTRALFGIVLATQMFPLAVLLIPIYLIIRNLGLLNTHLALILADLAFALPFAIWFLRSYFETIPVELEEAAFIDGCNRPMALWRITIPVAIPGVLASAFFTFLLSWDEYMMALTLTNRNFARTLPPGLIISYVGEFGFRWPEMMAASLVVILPILLVFAFFSRHLIAGLTEGAVK